MAKKVFLYVSYGYDFYTCEFEGLDANGKPRLTIMTPGCPVENFLEHLDILHDDPNNYFFLCEEGKPADPKNVVEMLGQIYMNSARPLERMTERLEEMRKCGIRIDHELQRMRLKILENKNSEPQSKSYYLELSVDYTYIGAIDEIKDLGATIVKLGKFFDYIEHQVHIPLRKHLVTSESLKKLVIHNWPNMFDDVDIF